MRTLTHLGFVAVISLSLIGCGDNANQKKTTQPDQKKSLPFSFADYPIRKSQLGSIRIGMTLTEADKLIHGLTKKPDDCWNFGIDDGEESGSAYVYSLQGKPVFALIPASDISPKTILFIVAIHEKLATSNGLHPKATVTDVAKIYPLRTHLSQDLMTDSEQVIDAKNHWIFCFYTNETTRIGHYADSEKLVGIHQAGVAQRADWIRIY